MAQAKDSRLYTAAMRVCGAAGKRDKVLELFERMREATLVASGGREGRKGEGGGVVVFSVLVLVFLFALLDGREGRKGEGGGAVLRDRGLFVCFVGRLG